MFLAVLAGRADAQCSGFPPAPVDDDCANYPTLLNNQNVNPGQTFAFCGNSPSQNTVTGVNLNGGIVRVCANASISGNFNSGTIVVACGATLTLPGNRILNNGLGIVNYGTVIVTGNLEFQNMNNYIYNMSPTSQLFVYGNMSFPQNNNQTNYLHNQGYVQVGGNLNLYDGGRFCMGEGSRISTNIFRYGFNCGGPANRIRYSGSNLGTAVLRYRESAVIRANLSNSSNVQIWSALGSTVSFPGCGGYGNAIPVPVTQEIPVPPAQDPAACDPQNCYTRLFSLPIELLSFEVLPIQGKAQVKWSTATEKNNDYFTLFRSADAEHWEQVAIVAGAGNSQEVLRYEATDEAPLSGLSFYQLKQTDFDGSFTLSDIVSVRVDEPAHRSLQVYQESASGRVFVVGLEADEEWRVTDLNGQDVTASLRAERNGHLMKLDPSLLPTGVFIVHSEIGSGKFLKFAGQQ